MSGHVLGWPLFPLKISPRVGIWNPSNTWFLGPTRVHNPNGILTGSAVFAGLAIWSWHTDWRTDRQTMLLPSVTVGHIYVLLWFGLKSINSLSQAMNDISFWAFWDVQISERHRILLLWIDTGQNTKRITMLRGWQEDSLIYRTKPSQKINEKY